jgi:hypothetical protein
LRTFASDFNMFDFMTEINIRKKSVDVKVAVMVMASQLSLAGLLARQRVATGGWPAADRN